MNPDRSSPAHHRSTLRRNHTAAHASHHHAGRSLEPMQKSVMLHLAVVYACAVLVSAACIGVLASRLYTHIVEDTIDDYGTVVAQQLAQASVDSVVRSDLVSLHAQLEKLVATNNIIDAAVYDMENRVLAQAGITPNARRHIPEDAVRNFPATITLQDSIAGKVIVSINIASLQAQQRQIYFAIALGLLLGLALVLAASYVIAQRVTARYRHLADRVRQVMAMSPMLTPPEEALPTPQQLDEALQQIGVQLQQLEQRNPAPKFIQGGKHSFKPTEGSYAELLVACVNLDILQQQLHPRELQKRLNAFQDYLQKTARLYHAIHVPVAGNQVLLRFPVNDVSDAALQAICCAVVLIGLMNHQQPEDTMNITLEFRFAVHWHEHDERPLPELLRNQQAQAELNELLDLCRQGRSNDIIVTKGIKQSPQVAEHTKLELVSGESDNDYYRVQKISDSYNKLLDQQVQQLATPQPA